MKKAILIITVLTLSAVSIFAHPIIVRNTTNQYNGVFGGSTPVKFLVTDTKGTNINQKFNGINGFTLKPGEQVVLDSKLLPYYFQNKEIRVFYSDDYEAIRLGIRSAGNGMIGIDKLNTKVTSNPNYVPNYTVKYDGNFSVKEIDFGYSTEFTKQFSA